jgi:type IV pilus assembly protein PilV
MKNHTRTHFRDRGVSMVEVLVALVIISVGMLGIAGLYLSSLQAGRSANLRVQAMNLTSDIADRIRANRAGLKNYEVTATGLGKTHDCSKASCTAKDLAENDLYLWKRAISAALPANANGRVAFLDNAAPAPDRYTITVTWREPNSDIDYTNTMNVESEP